MAIASFEDIWQKKKMPSFEEIWKPAESLDRKSPQFKEFALTSEGAKELATLSPDVAASIAAKEQPSRNDFKQLGVSGWNADERKQLSSLFRDAMAGITEGNRPQTKGYETPADLLRPGTKPPGPEAAGFWERLGQKYETPTEAIKSTVPVVSEMLSMMESAPAREAMSRLHNEKWDYNQWVVRPHAGSRMTGYEPFPGWKATREGDRKRIEDWFTKQAEEIERQEKGLTFGGQVAEGVSALPKYMGEFAMTGGFASLGEKAGQKVVLRIFGGRFPQSVMKQIWRASGWSARALARSATGFSPKIAANAIERHMPKQVHFDEQGKLVIDVAGETTPMSILKAWGEVTIESAGEETGDALMKMMPFGKKFTTGLAKLWVLKFGGKVDDVAAKMLKSGGYSGYVGELLEEDVTSLMHHATGIQGEGNLKERMVQSL